MMNTTTKGLSLILAGSFAIVACNDTKPSTVADALAQDSTLMLEVMLANQDSAANAMEDDSLPLSERDESLAAQPEPAPATMIAPAATAPTPRPEPVVRQAPTRAVAVQPTQRRAVAPLPRKTAPRQTVTRTVSNTRTTRPAATRPPAVLRSTVTVPVGTQLALESSRRICVNSSNIGDRFSARTTENLIGPLGTVIPRGATATAVVSSLTGSRGEERIALEIRSISVNGRVYSLSSSITEIELDRRRGAERCLPDDGRIVAELTQPLRLRL